jgi:hypothetical protein
MHETWPVHRPRNSDKLWTLVADAWDGVASSQRYVRSIESMTRRMKTVVESTRVLDFVLKAPFSEKSPFKG